MIESPYRNENPDLVRINTEYARRCMTHSLLRGEAPFASHLLYTQTLNDSTTVERDLGVACGNHWGAVADLFAFYTDLGWSEGMVQSFKANVLVGGRRFEFRSIKGLEPILPPLTILIEWLDSHIEGGPHAPQTTAS